MKFIKWILFKWAFRETSFKKILKSKTQSELEEFKQKALNDENYELAAVLTYYLSFKFANKETVEQN